MKFDKETVIVIAICGAILIGWTVWYPKWQASAKAQQQETVQTQNNLPSEPVPQQPVPVQNPTKTGPASASTPKIPDAKPSAWSVSGRNTVFYFNSNGVLDKIVLKNHKRTGSNEPLAASGFDGFDPLNIVIPGMTLKSIQASASGNSLQVVRTYAGSSTITVTQFFESSDKTDVLNCVMRISASPAVTIPKMIVYGGRLAPLKQFANDDLRDIYMLEYKFSGGKAVTVDPAAKEEKFRKGFTSQPLDWVAVSNKYFLSLLSASPNFNAGCELSNPAVQDADGKSFRLAGIGGVYSNLTVFPNKPAEFSFQYYLGPKILDAMKGLPANTDEAIHLAYWSWFEFLCRPMLRLLNILKDLTGSYGLAIILLTILVKLILWPLIHKGNKSMRRMQRLQPQLKELKEKYKDNQQEFSRQMMELYKKENVSPFGGCFPMLLQLPIFIALYSTLDSSVELRHVSFLWAQDLTRPDLVGPTIMGIGLHPFIIISTALMVVQQKMSPPAGDPAQQKMMMLMPVIMLFFFYSFPSGLALYWTVNNVLSIIQMKISQYSAKKEEENLARTSVAGKKS